MMKTNVKKILTICLLALPLLALSSCFEMVNSYNSDVSETLVRIYLSPSDRTDGSSTSQALPRTLMPSNDNARYKLIFTSSTTGEKIEKNDIAIATEYYPISLSTGNWTVEVTRYENGIGLPVSRGTNDFTVENTRSAPSVNVILKPIENGVGIFSYIVTSTVQAKGKITLQPVNGGTSYMGSLDFSSNSNSGKFENVPAGDYDVFVSLEYNGKSAGAYSAAHIYSGLETKTNNEFSFTDANFYSTVGLAGSVKINSDLALADLLYNGANVKVTAYNALTNAIVDATVDFPYGNGTNEWTLLIPQNIPQIYLSVEVRAYDGTTIYKKERALELTTSEIPSNGKTGINLTIDIYSISVPVESTDNSIKPSKTIAVSGEPITLTVSSTYGLKQGTLKVLSGSTEIFVTGSGTSYSFTMPDGEVSVSADFFTARLASLTVTSASGNETLPSLIPAFSYNTIEYTLSVPYSVTALNITAPSFDADETVIIEGPVSNLVANDINKIYITVTPPTGLGGISSRTYTILVSREAASNALTSLSVSSVDGIETLIQAENQLQGFDSDVFSYTLEVPYSVSWINVSATARDGATVTVTGDVNNLKSNSNNIIRVTVTPPANSGSIARTYTITVNRKAASNELATLTVISEQGEKLLTPLFNSSIFEYNLIVPYGVSWVYVSATAKNSDSEVIISNATTSLTVGYRVDISVTVLPPDEAEPGKYTVTVIREAASSILPTVKLEFNDTEIADIQINAVDWQNNTYSLEIESEQSQVTITVTATAPTNGEIFETSGNGLYTIETDPVTIQFTVRSESGDYAAYTITITREEPEEPGSGTQ